MAGELRRGTLFDAPGEPVLLAAADWITGAVSGSRRRPFCASSPSRSSASHSCRDGWRSARAARVALGCFSCCSALPQSPWGYAMGGYHGLRRSGRTPAIAATPIPATLPHLRRGPQHPTRTPGLRSRRTEHLFARYQDRSRISRDGRLKLGERKGNGGPDAIERALAHQNSANSLEK